MGDSLPVCFSQRRAYDEGLEVVKDVKRVLRFGAGSVVSTVFLFAVAGGVVRV